MLFDLPPVNEPVAIADAETAIKALHSVALDLGFESVSEIFRLTTPQERGSIEGWVWDGAYRSVEVEGERVGVEPLEIVGFSIFPGEGFEAACFSLARYPSTIAHPRLGRGRVKTHLSGWHSHDFCKTQYGSNHGMENFVRGHTGLIRVLDKARELGFLSEVHDEGNFWHRRDNGSLVAACEEWNRMIAAFFGGLKDIMGEGGTAPIFEHPHFERLEAEGRTGIVAETLDALQSAAPAE